MDERRPPRIPNTPGLAWKPRKDGWEARWQARTDLVRRGYRPKSARLWEGTEPNTSQRAWIADRCGILQTEMLVWGRGGVPVVGMFDGTIKTLVACYQTDKDSGYRSLRYKTKENYDNLTRRIERDHGLEEVRDLKARTFLRWHEEWSAGGKIAMAHALVGMLRTLFRFGATILEDADCERLSGVMHQMRFKMAKPRDARLTAEHAIAIRAKAHEMGLHSVALAQALQFECMLRQKDVIGEWVPSSERGVSDILAGNEKWLWGLRWSEIDDNLILRHTTSKRQKDVEIDLKLAPMVMEELEGIARPMSGPVVVSEANGTPYTAPYFRVVWRRVADAAGVPKAVRNMDSRAGAISEATDAGAELEHVRHAATHGDIKMTQRYSRGSIEKTATVMRIRAEHRNKK